MSFKFGVTGGLGAGKNTVVSILEEFAREDGIPFHAYDLDEIAKNQYVSPTSPAYPTVIDAIGIQILRSDMHVDTRVLGRIVFEQPTQLTKLEEILRPRIQDYLLPFFELPGMHCVNAALLLEKDLLSFVDKRVLLVTIKDKVRRERLRIRNPELSDDDISKRLKAQMTDNEKCKRLYPLENQGRRSYIVSNNGQLETLRNALNLVWSALKVDYEMPR